MLDVIVMPKKLVSAICFIPFEYANMRDKVSAHLVSIGFCY